MIARRAVELAHSCCKVIYWVKRLKMLPAAFLTSLNSLKMCPQVKLRLLCMATGWLCLASILFSWRAFQLLTHLTSAVCLRGASVGIIFTRLHLLFEEYLLFSFFSRKLVLFACKTSHLEARHGDCGDCNLPAHTVI